MKPKSIKFAAMTIDEANRRLLLQLKEIYDDREAANIADMVMEHVTGWKRIDRVVNNSFLLPVEMEKQIEIYSLELLKHRPVQYVLNEAWFAGMKFYVDESVLIPRPETEELVELVKQSVPGFKNETISVLDIGTGSGCISIAIKKNIPFANVHAIDISKDALAVATKNAEMNGVNVNFSLLDILDEKLFNDLPSFDLIISNPPYIPSSEKNMMHSNVVDFEPHVALFVNDDDPLIFYRAISRFADKKLLKGGKIFLEVHENYAEQVAELFYHAEIKKDLQEKQRMIIASVR